MGAARGSGGRQESFAQLSVYLTKSGEPSNTFRAHVFAGGNIGPEEADLQRAEFDGDSLDDVLEAATSWGESVLKAPDRVRWHSSDSGSS